MNKQYKKLLAKKPSNFSYWWFVIQNQEEIKQFFERGSIEQKGSIIRTLNYLKKYNKELFEKVNGLYWLDKFKNGGKNND